LDSIEQARKRREIGVRPGAGIRLHGDPFRAEHSLAGERYSNHSLVASSIEAGFHTGASRQYSMLSSMICTPRSNAIVGRQPSTRWILPLSADVPAGSAGRLGGCTTS